MRSAFKNSAFRNKIIKNKSHMTNSLSSAKKISNKAVEFLNKAESEKIFVCQEMNMGDTLHLTPVIHHYRLKYPKSSIIFMIAQPYINAHEHNPHINKLFSIPKLSGKDRIELRKYHIKICQKNNIKLISPSIHPHAEIWKELSWSYEDIASQYLHNSGVKDLKPLGGRKLILETTKADDKWASNFLSANGIKKDKACILEYTSYSAPVHWDAKKWKAYADRLKHYGIKCISVCGPNEGTIANTIPAKGITWRQTAALCNQAKYMTGCGSGITMIAAAAKNQPKILEILISPAVTMEGCGYAKSVRIVNPDPVVVADHLWHKLRN